MSEAFNPLGYGAKLMDHYEHPRNVGSFASTEAAVGTGMVGAPDYGDLIKLQIRVNAAGIIEEARFRTYGCCSAIASSSLVTEWLTGRTLEEAAAIRSTDIADELSLPPLKMHCALLAEDAIQAAIADYRSKHPGMPCRSH